MLKKFIILSLLLFCSSCFGMGGFIAGVNSVCYCVDPSIELTKEQIENGARNCTTVTTKCNKDTTK